jgi:carboxyl-terminal processing protease
VNKRYRKAFYSRKFVVFTAIFISIFLSGTIIFGTYGNVSASENDAFDPEYFESVMDMVKGKYAGEVEDSQLIEGALKGMLDTMDPYTTYFSQEQADNFFIDVDGTYEGIGLVMEKKSDYVVISKVFSGSPAEKSGLLQGDRIVTVDGQSVVGVSIEEVASLIKGETGTKVTLGIARSNSAGIINIDVTRMKIKINPVNYEIKDNIGYIKLEMFNANTNEFITNALKEMDKNNINKIILDLRDNPGGLVDQCVSLSRKFVPKGLITKLAFKSEDLPDQEYYSYLLKPKYDLVVLINGMSASASEIVAGAVQDTEAGLLVGTKTFGKAKVQNMVPILSPEAYKKYSEQTGLKIVDGHELIKKQNVNPSKDEIIGWAKITTGMYLTPKGNMIDGEGITPDIIIDDPQFVKDININSIQKLTYTWKPDLNDEGIDIYNAEKILKILGYDVDAPDTILDEKTFNAICKFRVDKELYPGGVLDFTTQKALNKELDRVILMYDKQYSKAVELLSKN